MNILKLHETKLLNKEGGCGSGGCGNCETEGGCGGNCGGEGGCGDECTCRPNEKFNEGEEKKVDLSKVNWAEVGISELANMDLSKVNLEDLDFTKINWAKLMEQLNLSNDDSKSSGGCCGGNCH